jgi:flagellar motor switch protein FliN/FliY
MAETATEERVEQPGEAEASAPEVSPEAVEGSGGERAEGLERSIEFLGGIELEAAVELGRTTMTIGEVLKLGPGSVVQLDKMLGDPVEMMVKDRLIARGEVVVVDDRFGLRITEVAARGKG